MKKTETDHQELRRILGGLSRAETRDLAALLAVKRSDIEDYADAGIELEPAAMAALRDWLDLRQLRILIDREKDQRRNDMLAATGLTIASLNKFLAGGVPEPAERAALERWLANGYRLKPGGEWVEYDPAPPPVLALGARVDILTPRQRRRLKLLQDLQRLPIEAIEAAHAAALKVAGKVAA